MFTKIYKETTDPNVGYSRLLSFDVILSIILHTIAYILIICVIAYIFNIKLKKKIYHRIVIFLIVVMTIGYPFRLMRVKSLVKNGLSPNIINNGYFTWYFIG